MCVHLMHALENQTLSFTIAQTVICVCVCVFNACKHLFAFAPSTHGLLGALAPSVERLPSRGFYNSAGTAFTTQGNVVHCCQ